MKTTILSSFLSLVSLSLSAQNLVPNSGFEENRNGMVTTWQQPLGGYYHYTGANGIDGYAYKGEFYNGLCLLNKQGSEYLQVKLIQPLVRDVEYKLCFYAKISGTKVANLDHIHSLDWHFPSVPQDVKGRAKIKVKPDVVFPLDTSMKYGQWRKFEQKYTAKGGETWLLIGKFFDTEDSINRVIAEMNKKILLLRGTHKKEVKKGTDSITAFYKALPEYNSKKKTQKQYTEFRKLMTKQIRETNEYRKKMNSLLVQREKEIAAEYDLLDYYYDVRFYFDEVSIVPMSGKHTVSMVTVPVGVPDKLLIGQKFTLENILFESGKSILLPASSVSLNKLVASLNKNPTLQLKISGHTDNVGNDVSNQKLSEERAKSVMNYLISKGISETRFTCRGFGSSSPIADNATPAGRKQNRRVEFEIK